MNTKKQIDVQEVAPVTPKGDHQTVKVNAPGSVLKLIDGFTHGGYSKYAEGKTYPEKTFMKSTTNILAAITLHALEDDPGAIWLNPLHELEGITTADLTTRLTEAFCELETYKRAGKSNKQQRHTAYITKAERHVFSVFLHALDKERTAIEEGTSESFGGKPSKRVTGRTGQEFKYVPRQVREYDVEDLDVLPADIQLDPALTWTPEDVLKEAILSAIMELERAAQQQNTDAIDKAYVAFQAVKGVEAKVLELEEKIEEKRKELETLESSRKHILETFAAKLEASDV